MHQPTTPVTGKEIGCHWSVWVGQNAALCTVSSEMERGRLAVCWVKVGVCGNEATIEARKVSRTKVTVSITSSCEHVEALAEALPELDIGVEMTRPLQETMVYHLAGEHLCRNSCLIPAAIFKAVEVAAGLFLPGRSRIEFVQGAV